MTGGRGQIRLKMSQLKMSQLGLRGGRVKLIETMSQNLQFFFLEGFPKSLVELSQMAVGHLVTVYLHQLLDFLHNYSIL